MTSQLLETESDYRRTASFTLCQILQDDIFELHLHRWSWMHLQCNHPFSGGKLRVIICKLTHQHIINIKCDLSSLTNYPVSIPLTLFIIRTQLLRVAD